MVAVNRRVFMGILIIRAAVVLFYFPVGNKKSGHGHIIIFAIAFSSSFSIINLANISKNTYSQTQVSKH